MPEIEKHIKIIKNKIAQRTFIKPIDYIYIINLDLRPEKMERSNFQLNNFGIFPCRFPAIYGWTLSQNVFDDIGLKFLPPMDFQFDRQIFFHMESDQTGQPERLDSSSYGKTCVHKGTSAGSLGGSLSHLSCMQDAYVSGYQTIWILEDDFTLTDDPHLLTHYIDRLDSLTNKNWDALYTDDDHYFPIQEEKVFHLRPDRPKVEHKYEHSPLDYDFFKIGGRWQLHSVIYRRSGIRKILNYIKQIGLFHTLDIELNFTPYFNAYNLRCGLIHGRNRNISDTQVQHF